MTLRWVMACWLAVPCSLAMAHSTLSAYVQHDVLLEASKAYLDLTVQLTFFDDEAEAQRSALDVNGDGDFSAEERAAFKKALMAEAEKTLLLHVDGAALELVSRFDPEIVCAVPPGGEAHLRFEIRLHFFADLPALPDGKAALEVHDSLFADVPAMASLRVSAKDGTQITATNGGRERPRAEGASAPLIFEAQLGGNGKSAGRTPTR
jgi:hypothetical protein